ncbi:MAG: hypothetical protein IPM58_01130 [Nitrospira sp.]|nr:hypothetical protein [Nitrospira sp.]
MGFSKNDVAGLFQASPNVMPGEDSRPLVYRRPVGWTIRVRRIDCLLTDIQAEIERLQQERTHLRLVRRELTGNDA